MNGHTKLVIGILGTLISGFLLSFLVYEVRINHEDHEYILREKSYKTP